MRVTAPLCSISMFQSSLFLPNLHVCWWNHHNHYHYSSSFPYAWWLNQHFQTCLLAQSAQCRCFHTRGRCKKRRWPAARGSSSLYTMRSWTRIVNTMWIPCFLIAKLVNITPITMVYHGIWWYMVYIYTHTIIVNGSINKPTSTRGCTLYIYIYVYTCNQ